MKKIPVVATIRAAYSFVFTHLGAIIGLIWIPMILVTVIGFFVRQRFLVDAADAFASNNYANLGPAILGLFGYLVISLFLYTVMYVPITQLALGTRKGGALVYFAFGAMEWRLFRALVGLVAFLALPVVLAALLSSTLLRVLVGSHGVSPQIATSVLELVMLLVYCGVIYVGLRFAFLLPAVTVTGSERLLPRSWELSRGNFWRLLAVLLATLAPVMIVAGIATMALEGHQAPLPSFDGSTAMVAAQLHGMSLNMPLTQGVSFLIAPLLVGLFSGASAAALTGLGDSTAADI